MRIVIQLQDDKGKMVKEVAAEGTNSEMDRIGAHWAEYFGNPVMTVPDKSKEGDGATKEVPADLPELFTRWAGLNLQRLNTMVKDHEVRQKEPTAGRLLG